MIFIIYFQLDSRINKNLLANGAFTN